MWWRYLVWQDKRKKSWLLHNAEKVSPERLGCLVHEDEESGRGKPDELSTAERAADRSMNSQAQQASTDSRSLDDAANANIDRSNLYAGLAHTIRLPCNRKHDVEPAARQPCAHTKPQARRREPLCMLEPVPALRVRSCCQIRSRVMEQYRQYRDGTLSKDISTGPALRVMKH